MNDPTWDSTESEVHELCGRADPFTVANSLIYDSRYNWHYSITL